MAYLRGNSKVGGKGIATVDIIKKLIESNESSDINSKLSKYSGTIATLNEFNNLLTSNQHNGIYDVQFSNKNPNDPLPMNKDNGVLLSSVGSTGKLQLFATQKSSGLGDLYLNSGLNGNNFQKIALQKDLDTKLNLTGGTLTGILNSNSDITTTQNIRANVGNFNNGVYSNSDITIESTNSDIKRFVFHKLEGNKDNSCFMYVQPSQFGFYDRKTNKEILYYNFSDHFLRSQAPQLILNGSRVWHEGNFDPNNYIPKATVRLGSGYDLNNLSTTGFYTIYQPLNAPNRIRGWCYIEVMLHSQDATNYILQKVYDFETGISYLRVKNAGVWKPWKPLAGANSYSKEIAANEWVGDNGAYSITITHNLGLDNITSVILTDSNKYSMSTGFSIIDNNKLKVYCTSNVAGKIVINAQP